MELLIKTELLLFHLVGVDWVENWHRDQEICLLFLLLPPPDPSAAHSPSVSQFLHL